MKRVTVFILAAILTAGIVGCTSSPSTSDGASGATKVANESNNSTPDASMDNSGNNVASAVPLVEGWPSGIPVIEGKITYSEKSGILNDKLRPTGKMQYTTSIETSKSNKEICDFYKSKFSKITQPGSADDKVGYCAGIIGSWQVSIASSASSQSNMYTVTIGVQPGK